MSDLKAHVVNGRLTMDAPTDLPDGTVLDLVVDDEGDDLSLEGRKALDAAITRAWLSVREGHVHTAEEVLGELRERRA